jgi:hypothetical protein
VSTPTVGLLGGSGTVGRVALDRLAGAGEVRLRVGGRDADRARAACRAVDGADTEVVVVDLHDPAALDAFCRGCDVVVNAAGPSYRVLDVVARAALAAGAAYVDAAGDAVARRALLDDPPAALTDRPALFSAGLMPGLTGVLPRLLAEGADLARVDLYVGGSIGISSLSAVDALLTRGPGFGTALASWRDGGVAPASLRPLRDARLPGFDEPVHAYPFLSVEAEALAAMLDLDELRTYTAYVSDEIPEALATAWADGERPVEAHAEAVVAAASRDVAAHGTWYALLCQARPRAGGAARRLLLRTPDSYELSGVVAAAATREVLVGRVPAGAHLAGEALDPHAVLAHLVGDPLVTELTLQ